MIGSCTYSRRYIDWEIKASLQQGQTLPNGLLAINLPYMKNIGNLPSWIKENMERNSKGGDTRYARYFMHPETKQQLRQWIEDAYEARTARSNLINNGKEMMKYNGKCNAHKISH